MKNTIKYIALLTLALGASMPRWAEATDIVLPTYYPALSGEYDQLRLIPRTADLTGTCAIGSLYVNSAKQFQYCRDNGGSGIWGSITDIWTQSGNDIFLTATLSERDLHVGIGTKTPEFELSINNDAGIIAKGTFGNGAILPDGYTESRLIWYPRKAAFRAGLASGTQWDDTNTGNYSVAMGRNSKAMGNYSSVDGGDNNSSWANYDSVIGGQNNIAAGGPGTVIGGFGNNANGYSTIVPGGKTNLANGISAVAMGGQNNQVVDTVSAVGGGSTNIITRAYSNINGGKNNTIDPVLTDPQPQYGVIGGGANNRAGDKYTVISGGSGNRALTTYASIGGGKDNSAGAANVSGYVGTHSRTSGGQSNIAAGDYSTVSGGYLNRAWGNYSTIGGGNSNLIAGNGQNATIAGGERNQINTGLDATIIGGTDNIADGDYSLVGGKNIQLSNTADRTFAWGYSDSPVSITQSDAFIIASGTNGGSLWNPRVGIRDITPGGVLEINSNYTTDDYINISRSTPGDTFIIKNNGYIGVNKATPSDNTYAMQFGNANNAYLSGGGVWTNASSRELKENIQPLSSGLAEKTLDQLNPVTFKYKVNRKRTVGFIAEDVPEAVAMKDRRSLSSMDIIAVLTKTAQDQEKQIKDQAQEIEEIKAAIDQLKKAVRK